MDNEVVTPEVLDAEIRDAHDFFLAPPMASVFRTAQQNIPTASSTQILFDTVLFDSDGMTDADTSVITIQTSGVYLVTFGVRINLSSSCTRFYASLQSTGSSLPPGGVFAETSPGGAGIPSVNMSFPVALTAGEALSVNAYQNTGSTQQTWNFGRPYLSVSWLGARVA